MEFRTLENKVEQKDYRICQSEDLIYRNWPLAQVAPTFLNTAGFGRAGPKKGTSSLAVTDT